VVIISLFYDVVTSINIFKMKVSCLQRDFRRAPIFAIRII